MPPRANFSCAHCGKVQGLEGDQVYSDLPVASTRCPVCGFKRGFRRLFDAIQVASSHAKTELIDKAVAPYQELRQTQHNLAAEQRTQRAPVAPQQALALAQGYARTGIGGGRPELVFGGSFRGPHDRTSYPFPS
jgi:hypothetical protein